MYRRIPEVLRSRPRQLWILVGVITILACRLPGRLAEIVRPVSSTLSPTATITPAPAVTDTRRPTQASKATQTEEPDATALMPSPAETATEQAPGEPYIAPQPVETLDQGAAPYPATVAPGEVDQPPAAGTTPEGAYPPPQNLYEVTSYPGAATDFPTYNPYPNGETPLPPASEAPSPVLESPSDTPTLPLGTQTASYSSTPNSTPVRASPTPTPPRQPPSLAATSTRTPFVLPSPTLTYTPTPTRTALPAPPWFNAQIKATDPGKVELAAGKPQLVEFFAYWSGPSLALAPVVQGIENEYLGRVIFTYLDIDNPATEPFKRELRFRYEPHFFLLDGQGNVLRQWLGNIPAEELRLAIEDALS